MVQVFWDLRDGMRFPKGIYSWEGVVHITFQTVIYAVAELEPIFVLK